MTDSISKPQLMRWLNDPTTLAVMSVIRKARDTHSEALINGQTLSLGSAETTALQTAKIVGAISGMNLILEISVEGEDE